MQLEKRESGNSPREPRGPRYIAIEHDRTRSPDTPFLRSNSYGSQLPWCTSLLISKTSSVFVPFPYISRRKYENEGTKIVRRSNSRTFLLKLKRFRLTMINNIWSHYAADTRDRLLLTNNASSTGRPLSMGVVCITSDSLISCSASDITSAGASEPELPWNSVFVKGKEPALIYFLHFSNSGEGRV